MAGGKVPRRILGNVWPLTEAAVAGIGAARRKHAPLRRVGQIGQGSRNAAQRPLFAVERGEGANQPFRIGVAVFRQGFTCPLWALLKGQM